MSQLTQRLTSPSARSTPGGDSPLQLVAHWGRAAATTDAPRALALEAAQAAAVALGTSHFGVTEILPDGQRLSIHVQAAGEPLAACVMKLDVAMAADNSLSAAALRRGQSLVAHDLSLPPLGDEELQALGIAAGLVVPLATKSLSYGALAVYHDAPRSFDHDEQLLVESLASAVTGALARCRAEAQVQQQQQFAAALQQTMQAMMLVLSADGIIQSSNPACRAVAGFADDDLVGRSIWSALMLPEEIGVVQRAMQRAEKQQVVEHFETYILTSDGLRRRIAWTAAALTAKTAGEQATILVTGIDITDRCEAVERAARAEAMAHDARRLCHDLQDRIRRGEAELESAGQQRRLPAGIEHDRRSRLRSSYPYVQRIAPLRGSAMPDVSQFNEWLCDDISSRGFSFISPTQPDYQQIVVAFGTPPALVYLTADVRHATRCEKQGRTQFVVGCRYTGRISKIDRGARGEGRGAKR